MEKEKILEVANKIFTKEQLKDLIIKDESYGNKFFLYKIIGNKEYRIEVAENYYQNVLEFCKNNDDK